ncbi:MAG: flavodoxin family protein [Methanomassiliicoccaceae archaeon]|nr:flavodoxin family protein [Methanomassiliicoccaceae archaeon]
MKVIALNGSPRLIGNTSNIVMDMLDMFSKEGMETEHVQLYSYNFIPCNDCRSCEMRGDGTCINGEDGFNELLDKLREADGIVFASPSYYGGVTGQMKIFMERAGLSFETGDMGLRHKVGGAIAVAAHDGASAAYSQMVNFMLRNQMIVCGSTPHTTFRALNPPQFSMDKEAVKAVSILAREMVWAMERLSQKK